MEISYREHSQIYVPVFLNQNLISNSFIYVITINFVLDNNKI